MSKSIVRHFVFRRNKIKLIPCGAKLTNFCTSTELLVTCKKCKRILNLQRVHRWKIEGRL